MKRIILLLTALALLMTQAGAIAEDGESDSGPAEALYEMGVSDITAKRYGGASQYAVIGSWTVAYGNCDNHYCIFGWNENTREYHILAETVVSDFVPAGDVFAYYGEVKKGKFGWLVRNPDAAEPVSLSLSELSTVFWSDEDYLYYYTFGKGTGTTYYRMDYDGKNKKQLGKLNGRAVAMTADGGVVVFNSKQNRVEVFRDKKHETLYQSGDNIRNVVSTGREIWVAHDQYFGLVRDNTLGFQFNGALIAYAATTDQIIAVLDDGTIRLRVLMLNDAYGAHAEIGMVTAQENIRVEATPGWYNRVVVWGQRESLEFVAPNADAWLPYGYFDMEAAKADGYESASGFEGIPHDISQTEGDMTVERRIPDELLGEEADVIQEAEERGIYITHDRDGLYTYKMDSGQYEALLTERREEIIAVLELAMMEDAPTLKSYELNDDFSLITLRVDGARMKEDAFFVLALSSVAMSAPAYQSLFREEENPVSVITILDDETGQEIGVITAPDDLR